MILLVGGSTVPTVIETVKRFFGKAILTVP